ncbi:gamma-glutamylcyclotransferase family protein [Deinococcus pimensis]|uniref:gamma-glutamylcyclotransferase family protein n=1 Tax=Deinococcus pimensis TaxID=309888 RepID=UPI00047F75C9|nr:gamma-glutamylcyclotransferase family protein [Deinococcus pimensis]
MTGDPDASPRAVFVYGTLMPGEYNAGVAGEVTGARTACLPGFELWHLDPEGYPAVTPGTPDEVVRGVLLTFAEAVWPGALARLDRLEGLDETPPLYARVLVDVVVEGGTSERAWVYVYAREERLAGPGATRVPDGDWRSARAPGTVPARS